MKTLISIDPGLSSGIVIGTYSDTEPYRRTHAFQIEDGLRGLTKFMRVHEGEDWGLNMYKSLWAGNLMFDLWREERVDCELTDYDTGIDNCTGKDDHQCDDTITVSDVEIVTEKFTPRPNQSGGGLSLKSAEPLLCEGFLVSSGIMPYYDHDTKKKDKRWRAPSSMYFTGGKSLADKKKNLHAWLKSHDEMGLYVTGKEVGCKDANDVRSSLAHSIAYLRDIRHTPTLDYYFKEAR